VTTEPALLFREATIQGGASVAFDAIARWDGDLKYLELETSNWMGLIKTYGGFLDPKRKHWDWCFIEQLLIGESKQLDEADPAKDYLNFVMPFAAVSKGQRVRLVIQNRDNIQHNLRIKIPLEVDASTLAATASPSDDGDPSNESPGQASTALAVFGRMPAGGPGAPTRRPDVALYGGRHGHNHRFKV
jgi:hypothetical protein